MNVEQTNPHWTSQLYRSILSISARRWLLLLSGLACFGFGVALMVQAGLGLSPWESLHQGIAIHTGIPIGTVSILLGVPILLLWLPLGERPGIGTVLNVILIGSVTNLTLPLLPKYNALALQLVQMVLGILIIGAGSGLYLSSKLGAGPRDGLMMGLARRTGWSIRITRTGIELTVLAIAWLLGGTIGLGTLAFALGIGPVVQLMFRLLRTSPVLRPMLSVPAIPAPVPVAVIDEATNG
jgi:uncharacterized membrane protein YczE